MSVFFKNRLGSGVERRAIALILLLFYIFSIAQDLLIYHGCFILERKLLLAIGHDIFQRSPIAADRKTF